jgi:hypothetical protein
MVWYLVKHREILFYLLLGNVSSVNVILNEIDAAERRHYGVTGLPLETQSF